MSPDHNNNLTVIALGANLPSAVGGRKTTVTAAVTAISQSILQAVKVSRFFQTPAFPAGNGPDYINAVLVGTTLHESAEVLRKLHAVEDDFGRTREQRWGQRVLDLDLIAHGPLIAPDLASYETWRDLPLDRQTQETPQNLILPHPRLQDRAFVLGPMMDVAPDWVHPVSGLTCRQMWMALSNEQRQEITPLHPA